MENPGKKQKEPCLAGFYVCIIKKRCEGASLELLGIHPYVGIIQIRLRVETIQPPLSRLLPAPRDSLKFSDPYLL